MLAEQLGFDATDRVAVIHADDVGMCHAVNQGAFHALENGSVTCASLMVPCAWFPEAAEIARARPELDLGVHLTLNSEFDRYRWGPVAGRDAVPSLLDDEGYLHKTVLEVLKNAAPDEVETELRAQIETALASGVDVTHLDSHMGTVTIPPLSRIYKKLALEYRLPAFAVRPSDEALAALGLPEVGPTLRQFADEIAAEGFPVLDGFDANSLAFEPGQGRAHNEKRLAGLPVGVSYLICHPAQDGEELFSVCPAQAHQRDFEREFYGGPTGAAALVEHGIKTTGMRPLRDLLR